MLACAKVRYAATPISASFLLHAADNTGLTYHKGLQSPRRNTEVDCRTGMLYTCNTVHTTYLALFPQLLASSSLGAHRSFPFRLLLTALTAVPVAITSSFPPILQYLIPLHL